jgi:hypothetical protein
MKFVLSVLRRQADGGNSVQHVGDFGRQEDAIAAAKQVVDAVLMRTHAAGMSAPELLENYRAAAETPYISRDDEGTMSAGSFNHFQYAKARSEEICAAAPR